MNDDRTTPTPARDLLAFWFDPESKQRWFDSTPAFDELIRQRYEGWLEQALNGELSNWESSPKGALALVILLDQFPLNMYRGQPRGFEGEAASREVADRAIDRGFDQRLDDEARGFLYLPFMHSENLEDQRRSVDLYRQAGLDTRWAEHHYDIVRRFGRFPHRNAILGRDSTVQELAYLESDEAFSG